MDHSNPVDIRHAMPSLSSIIITYAVAVSLMALATYATYGVKPPPGTILWVFAAAWVGKAAEKSIMWWKISKMSRGDVGEKAE